MSVQELVLTDPFDAHRHLREALPDQEHSETICLDDTLPDTWKHFSGAICMTNLKRPLDTPQGVMLYSGMIQDKAALAQERFHPVCPMMLTWRTTPDLLVQAADMGIKEVKLLPANLSTNTDAIGITLWSLLHPAWAGNLEVIRDRRMKLLVHPEVSASCEVREIHYLYREVAALSAILELIKKWPDIAVVLEHVSDQATVELIKSLPSSSKLMCTLSPQHLTLTFEDVFKKNQIFAPHNFCMPVAKSAQDRRALGALLLSGNRRAMLGTDDAPHHYTLKEGSQPKAGVCSGSAALSIITGFLAAHNRSDLLQSFVSDRAREFYGQPGPGKEVRMLRQSYQVPSLVANGKAVPFLSGECLDWRVMSA